MIDSRFYHCLSPVLLSELVDATGAHLQQGNPEQHVHSVGPINALKAGIVGYAVQKKHLPKKIASGAVIVINQKLAKSLQAFDGAVLVHEFPMEAFAAIAKLLVQPITEYSRDGEYSSEVSIHPTARIGPGVAFGKGASIGKKSIIGANTTIGAGVIIGDECVIGSGVHISFAQISNFVNIYSGAVIGEQGFGTEPGMDGLVDVPHFGTVHIANNVTIGSNTTIDRGVFSATKIGRNTKIDNLVQIGHNVVMGENCVLAAYVGISGSVRVGNRVRMGGRVGITEHVRIGDDCTLFAGSSLIKDMPANETWSGTPAQPFRQHLREIVAIQKMVRDIQKSK